MAAYRDRTPGTEIPEPNQAAAPRAGPDLALECTCRFRPRRCGELSLRYEFVPEAYSLKWGGTRRHHGADVRPSQLRGIRHDLRESEDHAAYKELHKYVVSSPLSDDTDRQTDGGPIYIHGSAELAQRLSGADLIDRYNLFMFPVLLGAGKSLFGRG